MQGQESGTVSNALDDRVARFMAEEIVAAFEAHDRKAYDTAAQHFGNVYTFLFPEIEVEQAQKAGQYYVEALKRHDVIEDGLSAVTPHAAVTEDVERKARTAEPDGYHDHPVWWEVHESFLNMAETLGVPEAYALHQAEFFRYHTAVVEDDSLSERERERFEDRFQQHAFRAQMVKFGDLAGSEVAEDVARRYLEAVESHDAHTPEEQEANRQRMAEVYETVLGEVYG